MRSAERVTSPERAFPAVFIHFVCNGLVLTSWTARIPGVSSRLGLSPDQLGLLLLCLALGSLVSMARAGRLIPRLGTGWATRIGSITALAGSVLLSFSLWATSPALAGAGLFVLGCGLGFWDVSMNVEGADVEHRLGRTVMPRFHAGFSLGTVAGGLLGAGLAAADVPIPVGLISIGVICLIAVIAVTPRFLDSHQSAEPVPEASVPAETAGGKQGVRSEAESGVVKSPWREGRTLLIGVVAFACALTEGAAMDWVAKGAADGLGASESEAALVFSVFVVAMTLTRWFGTRLVDRWGRVPSLRVCLAVCCAGLVLFVLAPNAALLSAGAFLWGVGGALGFPLSISTASDEPARAAARVSTVSFIAYGAFFLGPPVIGWLGHQWGVRPALGVIALPVLAAFLLAPVTRPPSGRATTAARS
ncbi:MFS transporter [Arthrobacter sp. UM1]|uniref:MFS transporter n=1 Tax=Arthrobacter sp. UM1 TaxID=2766776 RepID=UPI001CF60CEE|nr:MFS transporter [Arthrobacter sp. UM1]MCB4208607.1 MFS transporter [Arthrobacter sp. UM1]